MKEKFNPVSKESQSADNLTVLKRVSPTNTLWFLLKGPMPCERQTAALRNRTITSIEEQDIRSVAYRYLQNRSGEKTTRNEVIFYGIVFMLFLYLFTLPEDQTDEDIDQYMLLQHMLLLRCFCMPLLLNVPPNVCNTLRYRETKKFCEDWLTQKLGKKDFQQIEKVSYSRDGFFKLNELLDKKDIPPAVPGNAPSRCERFLRKSPFG